VIKSFRSKALRALWERGTTAKIDRRMHDRIKRRLDALDQAFVVDDLKIPGFDLHPLHGFDPVRWSVHVNGPWCLTFEFEDGQVHRVDFEQYH